MFAIPGPLILSITAGALYGKVYGLILVSIVATLGASCCFLLSNSLAKYWILKNFYNKIKYFQGKIDNNRDNLFFYMLFLRVTPLVPNWLVNLSSPLVEVPFSNFFFATLIGLIPANIFHVTMGSEIKNLKKIGFDMNVSDFNYNIIRFFYFF